MKNYQEKQSEAYEMAIRVTQRYGRLALTRAAGEAAAAQRKGDDQNHSLWTSVVTYLRESIQQSSTVTA